MTFQSFIDFYLAAVRAESTATTIIVSSLLFLIAAAVIVGTQAILHPMRRQREKARAVAELPHMKAEQSARLRAAPNRLCDEESHASIAF